MTKKELIRIISSQTGYEQKVVNEVINVYTDTILNELQAKHSFRFDRLGTLWYINSVSRNGFNPFNRKHEVFKGKNKIKLVPSKWLAKMLNPSKED